MVSLMSSTRRLLLCNWIFAALLLVAVNGQKVKCNEIDGTLLLTDDPDICDATDVYGILGNGNKPTTLDFSKAENKTLNDLLARKFTIIKGAMIVDDNDKLVIVNFADIATWEKEVWCLQVNSKSLLEIVLFLGDGNCLAEDLRVQ